MAYSSNDITGIDKISNYDLTYIKRLPDYPSGQPLIVRLKSTGMIKMISSGAFPNNFMDIISKRFGKSEGKKGKGKEEENDLNDISQEEAQALYAAMEGACREAMVEPTYEEILSSGIYMTEEQMMEVFNSVNEKEKEAEEEEESLATFPKE